MAKKRRNVRYSRVNRAKPNLVLREVDYIIARAAESDARFVTLGQLLFLLDGVAVLLDGVTLCNHSLSATRTATSTAAGVINMPNRHRRALPKDGQKSRRQHPCLGCRASCPIGGQQAVLDLEPGRFATSIGAQAGCSDRLTCRYRALGQGWAAAGSGSVVQCAVPSPPSRRWLANQRRYAAAEPSASSIV
jgi:hypothetical protein